MADEAELRRLREERVQLAGRATADPDLYGGSDRADYAHELDVGGPGGDFDADDDMDEPAGGEVARKMASYTAPKSVLAEVPRGEVEDAEQARSPVLGLATCPA
jgi:splicing factor 3B subunit 1